MSKRTDKIPKLTWVYISGAAFLFFLLLAVFMFLFAPSISGMGITKSFYYVILVPVGLASAAFLFGALRSGAKYVGKNSFGSIELTGPVVIFCLVIIGGIYFAPPETDFSLTIRTSISNEPEKILNYGSIIIDVGEQRIKNQVNDNGEVSFPGLSSRFVGQTVHIIPQIKNYKIKGSSSFTIPESRIIYLQLEERKDSTIIRGRVVDENNDPIDSVLIDIGSGLASSFTDENGIFNLIVPVANGETVMLTALKNGVTGYRELITISGEGSLDIKFRKGL